MHSYSIDSAERRTFLLILAAIKHSTRVVFLQDTWLLQRGFAVVDRKPIGTFLYGILFEIFDKRLWAVLKRFGIVRVPDLRGEWHGTHQILVRCSFFEHQSKPKSVPDLDKYKTDLRYREFIFKK